MADQEKKVPLYFIGVNYNPKKILAFNVKNRVYQPERAKNGDLVIGGTMLVNEHDAESVIDKSRVYKRNKGFMEVFTRDAAIAAAVRQQSLAGNAVGVSARMTLAEANQLLGRTPPLGGLTDAELMAELERRKAIQEQPEEEKSVDNEVEEKPVSRGGKTKMVEEAPVEEKPVNRGGRPKKVEDVPAEPEDELLSS